MDRLVFPALASLGEAWADGRMDIAAQHAASHAVLRRLGAAFQAAGRPGQGAPILVGLPPQSRHELGALAFAVAARRAGLQVLYLGTDLPASNWVDAAAACDARAAVVGVVTVADRPAAGEVVAALRAALPDLVIALGGGAAEVVDRADGRDRDHRLICLPGSLTEAVDALQSALDRAAGAPS
jgi:methylmalonyl-CoA mutase cobalamin-binding subunit